jgi:CHC2 zinc finger
MDRATIEMAKERLRIAELWRLCGFEGNPSACCQSPFREDRKPSFSVYADGLRWKDFASGEEGDAIDFLGKARGIENRQAIREFLALVAARNSIYCTSPVSYLPNRSEERRPDLSRFRLGSIAEIEAVAKSRGVDQRAVSLAQEMGCLLFGPVYGLPSWILTDVSGRCAEARRIDRQPYPADMTKAERKAHALIGSPKSWPVGCLISSQYRNHGNTIALVEGGPDYLAILHLALRAGRVDIQPVAVLGRSQCIHGFHPDSVELFRRRRVRIFPHADTDGNGIARALVWARQLENLNCQVDLFRLEGLTKTDGTPIKDLNDLVELHPSQANALEGIFP